MKHTLELAENAIDSFNEALEKLRQAEAGAPRAYKFAILHFSHFLELLFKHHVTQSHELLIYKNPFARDVRKQPTIGLWEALQFLENEGRGVPPEFKKDIEWLKELRNNIEHSRFEMDVATARDALGRLTKAMLEFNELSDVFDIRERIAPENLGVFERLSDEHKQRIADAEKEAREQSDDGEADYCNYCGNETAAKVGQEYLCTYCGSSDEVLDCCVCGDRVRKYWLSVWNDDNPPHIDYICDGCVERISSRD